MHPYISSFDTGWFILKAADQSIGLCDNNEITGIQLSPDTRYCIQPSPGDACSAMLRITVL